MTELSHLTLGDVCEIVRKKPTGEKKMYLTRFEFC